MGASKNERQTVSVPETLHILRNPQDSMTVSREVFWRRHF